MPDDKSNSSGPFTFKEGRMFAFHSETNEYLPVNDVRDEWKADAERFPITDEQRKAFFQQRIKLVESSGATEDHKEELLQTLKTSLNDEESNDTEESPEPKPVPGGVGYGTFYRDGSLKFNNSSTLYFDIVTNETIGNAANEWLYLTSTNRASKGVEAYLSYHRQEKPTFNIFDWSKTGDDQFALQRPYDFLADYLSSRSAAGTTFSTLSVLNNTRRLADSQWANDVMLHNPKTKNYDWVYGSKYDLTPFEEKKYLWWGPIVETFPPFPFAINNVGFFDAQLLQDEKPQAKLTNAVTELRRDHPESAKVVLDPNYSFVVRW